jgi:hypothetical protein
MKKTFSTLVIILCVFSLSFSQLPMVPRISFTLGPKVGFTMSSLTTNQDSLKTAAQNGFEGGFFFRLGINRLYFQPEVIYVTKGGVFENNTSNVKQEVTVQSIDIPIMIGLKFGAGIANFRVHGGPVLSYVIGKKLKVDGLQWPADYVNQRINNSSTGIQLGAGMDILSLSLDVRYEWGLDNLFVAQPGDPGLKWKQRMLVVGLALKLI